MMLARLRRLALTVGIATSVALPIAGAARPGAIPAPAPTVLPTLDDPTAAQLDQRYRQVRDDIAAAADAAADVDADHRAQALRAMASDDRRFLSFDGRDGGRSVEVFGDLATADRIAVLVPGSDTGLDRYRRLRADASALHDAVGRDTAVIAWLGYRVPRSTSPQVLTDDAARDAVEPLHETVTGLHAIAPGASVSVLCHSYGTVVCGLAAADLDVTDVILYGSPGTGVDSVSAMDTSARVWAGRGDADWIEAVPNIRIGLFGLTAGFGPDPTSGEFGARSFDAGDSGHDGYLRPGSVALRGIADIVTGAAS